MFISLEQAIEIHARALVSRCSERGPLTARRYAAARLDCGDLGGYDVWLAVALVAEQMLAPAIAGAVAERAVVGRFFQNEQ
ncbi:hypothetical protein [Methylocystis echinoides]|uniref:Uncharacterized protein n=1 Tax=Methylocystis echinoides TaxID=29468 RepID=A0A9W6GYW4_9HYPH|nr:hypothetical protein [Methylocystis echinoides]GLI95370.1 hypothetical protein LMG27198_43620 [Methylocystis echinoides]